MKLKIWLLALALFLVMAISGTTYGVPAVVNQGITQGVTQDVPYAQDISSNTPLVVSGRTLDWITIKRNNPLPQFSLKNPIDWGHYWIEMEDENGNIESYGWYPSPQGTSFDDLFGGQRGELRTDDYLHYEGQTPQMQFHPISTTSLSDQEIRDEIREFAENYKENNNYALLWESCQNFQKELMNSVGLKAPSWLVETGIVSTVDAPTDGDLPSWSETNPSQDNSEVGQDVGQSAVESSPSSIQSSSAQQEPTGTSMSNEEVGQQVSETVGSIFEAGATGMIDHPDASVEETIQTFQDMIPTNN